MNTLTLLLVVCLALTVLGVVLYNRLVALRNRVRNAYSQIDVQLQRRYELIPNLVETARAYLVHERETLLAVTEARNGAERCRQAVLSAGTDAVAGPGTEPGTGLGTGPGPGPGAERGPVAELAAAERGVAGALGQLNLVMEAYPELKADERMNRLHEDLASTENRVAFARQAYSDAVMRYNTGAESFPAILVARALRFLPAELFEAASEEHREAITVSFA